MAAFLRLKKGFCLPLGLYWRVPSRAREGARDGRKRLDNGNSFLPLSFFCIRDERNFLLWRYRQRPFQRSSTRSLALCAYISSGLYTFTDLRISRKARGLEEPRGIRYQDTRHLSSKIVFTFFYNSQNPPTAKNASFPLQSLQHLQAI